MAHHFNATGSTGDPIGYQLSVAGAEQLPVSCNGAHHLKLVGDKLVAPLASHGQPMKTKWYAGGCPIGVNWLTR